MTCSKINISRSFIILVFEPLIMILEFNKRNSCAITYPWIAWHCYLSLIRTGLVYRQRYGRDRPWRPSGNKLTSMFAISDLPIGVEAFKPVAFHFRQIIMTHIDRVHFVIVWMQSIMLYLKIPVEFLRWNALRWTELRKFLERLIDVILNKPWNNWWGMEWSRFPSSRIRDSSVFDSNNLSGRVSISLWESSKTFHRWISNRTLAFGVLLWHEGDQDTFTSGSFVDSPFLEVLWDVRKCLRQWFWFRKSSWLLLVSFSITRDFHRGKSQK